MVHCRVALLCHDVLKILLHVHCCDGETKFDTICACDGVIEQGLGFAGLCRRSRVWEHQHPEILLVCLVQPRLLERLRTRNCDFNNERSS